uniref:Chromosome 8 open reading frame 74 n=1 Tax=Capra hircus TaxID=9925 RepID=A0A452FX88_CAPHI
MALLTAQGVERVFQLQKPEGREHLRRLLNWEEFDEVRDPRRSILLDTLYESIIFAVGKGFPWREVAQVVKFTEELLKETKGCSITEAVTILGNKLRDYQGQFNTTHLLALCDYFHNTFIRHYKLYQYVLGQDRDVNLTVANLEVCTPPQPLPLAEGKDREVWKHEQQLEGLSSRVLPELAFMEAWGMKEGPCLPATFCFLQELEKLINEAIHIQIECLKELLQYEIQITFDILDLKLQKKTLNLNAPIPPLVPIAGQSGQDEALKLSKTNKGKKAKAKK